jgi:hypothetical protein
MRATASISAQIPYFFYAIHPAFVVDLDKRFFQLESQRFPWRQRLGVCRKLLDRPFVGFLHLTRHVGHAWSFIYSVPVRRLAIELRRTKTKRC